ncbi:MAG UNVERIFIED_CONTAM: hypothetical protein LVR18_50255 [Planctomycetaceae bacterium]|jgi:lactate dehydrogenase-like 2-hydroxyacid dehydrogenase
MYLSASRWVRGIRCWIWNVVLTDHIASHTWAGRHRLYEMAVLQLLQVLRGEQPESPLNSV